ncbi:hypothetical protein KGQ64_05780 [bacterium]|nr:hypothetical protein [bacterium]
MSRLDASDLDLLTSAFRPDDRAIDAFRRWSRGVDWQGRIDDGAYELLPAVHRNLRGLGHDDPLLPRFKGVARKAWIENQRARAEMPSRLFSGAPLPLLALPPTSLLFVGGTVVPHRRSLRLATRCEDAARTIAELRERNWRPVGLRLPPAAWLEGYVRATDHLAMRRGADERLSLTWRLETWFGSRSGATWANAESVSPDRTSILVPRPTDALEFALRQPVPDRPLSWLANALLLASQPIDWAALRAILAAEPPGTEQAALIPVLDEILEPTGAALGDVRASGSPAAERTAASPFGEPARWAAGAWRRFRGSFGASTPWPRIAGQVPGYVVGRWHVARHRPAETPWTSTDAG